MEIEDVIKLAIHFYVFFGINPDMQKLKAEYIENQLMLNEEEIKDFDPKTPFDAFCYFYGFGNNDYNRGIFDTVLKYTQLKSSGFTLDNETPKA